MKLQNAYTKTIGFKADAENRKVVVCRGIVREIPSCKAIRENDSSPISLFLRGIMENRSK